MNILFTPSDCVADIYHLHEYLPSGIFSSGLQTKILYAFLIPLISSVRSAHLTLVHLIFLAIYG
jgi:hypothetical protein